MSGSVRTIREATKALQIHFTGPKVPVSLPTESRRMLQCFVEDFDGRIDYEDASAATEELRLFWDRYIGGNTHKLGAFAGVLKDLRPVIVVEDDIWEWYRLAIKPVVTGTGFKKQALEDAQDFLSSVMIYDEDDRNAKQRSRTSQRICNDLVATHIARTRDVSAHDDFVAPENHQIAKQIESALITFGKKMPKQLFHVIGDLIGMRVTRLQGLTLLSSLLQHQAPHLYTVIHTPVVDHLLKCLMNDTSTTMISVALTSLIMLLPHIPSSLNSRLPRLFLIYSRLLCWEKFSPLSTEAQKSLVTDDRISTDDRDHGDVGLDPTWEVARPSEATSEPSMPEVATYFTHLYGMYPLNLMSYIRKPRRFLKNLDFPGADDFDLDQAVIRNRSDQFRQIHLLHPNFYNMTIEEELLDPKWSKMDPADVAAECHALALHSKSPQMLSPGPPPIGKLPDLPPLPPSQSVHPAGGSVSPSISNLSVRSGNSWRDTSSTAVDAESPVLGPFDDKIVDDSLRPRTAHPRSAGASPVPEDILLHFPGLPAIQQAKEKHEPRNNLEYLQHKLAGLQNELNFERWHKAQYSQHISQLMRTNVKDATVEAKTLDLINANRALKQQLEQVRSAREATIKDSNLTRKQANNVDANMTERFNKMKKEQETWAADSDELKRLRAEMKHYRDLLSTVESRELNKSHQLEIMKRDVDQLQKLQLSLQEAQRKVREYEFREFDFDQAKREVEIVQSEKETLHMRVQRQEQDRERTKRVYVERISELEAQLETSGSYDRPTTSLAVMNDNGSLRDLADAHAKLTQLKKAHTRLLERYTDLELEYQSVKNQLTALQGYSNEISRRGSMGAESDITPNATLMGGALGVPRGGILESVYGVESEYGAPSEMAYSHISSSDPTSNRYDPRRGGAPGSSISPPRSEINAYGGLVRIQPNTSHRRKESDGNGGYNATAPLRSDERSVASGQSAGSEERKKITANSEVRVYGRGGAQNIKMKPKDEQQQKKDPFKKSGGGFKALKGMAGL